MKKPDNRILLLFLLVVGLFLLGIAGYMLLEGWSMLDAAYMTIITLGTVGFGEVHPLSSNGRLFTIVLIVLGVGMLAYGLRTVAQFFLEQDYVRQWRQRQIMRSVNDLEDHYIICGLGRVGLSAAQALQDSKRPFVAIEKGLDPNILLDFPDMLIIDGDATDDDVLIQAGVARARGIIVTAGDDSVNLFVVLSARALNPDLFIITRSVAPGNIEKMKLAGANRVVSPYQIGGKHMANIAIRPHVTDFFEIATLDDGIEVWVEELVLHENSVLLGKTVGEIDVRRRYGVTLVALRHHIYDDEGDPERVSTMIPDANTCLQAGDELIVLGTRDGLAQLEAVACR
jgi:voltage-gated potassium channel